MDLMEEKIIALAKEKELIEKVSGPPLLSRQVSSHRYFVVKVYASEYFRLEVARHISRGTAP
jgi:hypothetical protein